MKKRSNLIIILLLFSLSTVLFAAIPLPPEKVFRFEASVSDHETVLLHWHVAHGYYLYVDKFQFKSTPVVEIMAKVPQGEFKYDATFGKQEVLTGNFFIPLTFKPIVPLTLTVHYQGCSYDGFCYPPKDRHYRVNFANHTIEELTTKPQHDWLHIVFDQEQIKQLLQHEHPMWMLLIFFAFGLFLAFTPCVLPMLPILSSIIMGDTGKRHPVRALSLSFFYVLGAAVAYALIGLLAASAGQSLQVMLQKPLVIMMVCGLFLLLAAINFGWMALIFPRVWQKAVQALNHRLDGGSYFGVFTMGIVSTCVVSPCITAPLLGALLYIAQTGDKLLGAMTLFSMGLGLGLPLLIAGTSLSYLLPKSGAWLIAIKHGFGFIMLGMALWLISRLLHPAIIYGMSAFLLLTLATYIAFLLPRYVQKKKACLVLAVLIGLFGFYAMAQNAPVWLQEKENSMTDSAFIQVNTITELDKVLADAKADKKPVLVDFYATWCTSCIIMEKEVLASPKIKPILTKFRLLRVDLTNNATETTAIMQRYNVIAPPTFLLFDDTGRELTELRIVGEVDVAFFLSRLGSIPNHK